LEPSVPLVVLFVIDKREQTIGVLNYIFLLIGTLEQQKSRAAQ
jgi:hypothetical protein